MGKTALFAQQQPGGLFAIEDQSRTTGARFFVHATTGTDAAGYGTHPDAPVASLDYAIGLCTASKGDVIYAMPGHAETTTAIALDVAGVSIVGLGTGATKPTLTATTAATDLLNITAANCSIDGIRFVGAASGNTALVDLGATSSDAYFGPRCEFLQAATPLSAITVSGASNGADGFIFDGCLFRGTANGPDRVFSIETGTDRWIIRNCTFLYPSGLDNELVKSVAVCEGYLIENVRVIGVDTLLVNFSSSSAGGPDGLFASGYVMASAALASIEDMVAAATSKGMAFGRLYAADATGKASGLIPLTTIS